MPGRKLLINSEGPFGRVNAELVEQERINVGVFGNALF
jgi:hypothetical protein